jgi:pSer/pThr/pTyr-binding forkhead associated (FHA) protein
MPARLTLHFASAPARVLALPEGRETVVGRDVGCGVAIADDRVSRRHAVLAPGSAGWTVRDLGSKNGTLADAAPVSAPRPLAASSWLSFGGVLARFEVVPEGFESPREELRRRLTTAHEVRRGWDGRGAAQALPELLERVAASMLELTGAERGFLLLPREDGGLEVAARAGLSRDDLRSAELAGSVGAVTQVLASGQPVVRSDVRADADLGARASVVAAGIRALICVAVTVPDGPRGAMYADSRRPGAAFTELDLEILEALAEQAGLAVAVARLQGKVAGLAGLASRMGGEDDATRVDSWQDVLTVLSVLSVRPEPEPRLAPQEPAA